MHMKLCCTLHLVRRAELKFGPTLTSEIVVRLLLARLPNTRKPKIPSTKAVTGCHLCNLCRHEMHAHTVRQRRVISCRSMQVTSLEGTCEFDQDELAHER
jgi:hypothetical protein